MPFLEAVWTSPFFLPGTVLATALPGRTIHVAPSTGPAPTLVGGTGGSGTAHVVHLDVEPCKVRSLCPRAYRVRARTVGFSSMPLGRLTRVSILHEMSRH